MTIPRKIVIISMILVIITTAVFSSGCISHSHHTSGSTKTIALTKTVLTTTVQYKTVTNTHTISTFYVTTMYTTQYETITMPITTTIIISNGKTSTIVNSSGSKVTLMKFTGTYQYADIPFLVYSIKGTTKIVTVPQSYSPIIGNIINLIHESIENKYTMYTPLEEYIGKFDVLRLNLLFSNFQNVSTPISFSDLIISHEYNPLYGAIYLAGFAMNYYRPVTILLAVKNSKIIDAYMGFNNTYYSKYRIMYFNAVQYSWFTKYGTHTEFIIALDPNGIITRIMETTVTNIPSHYQTFYNFAHRQNYGLEFSISSSSVTVYESYFVQLGPGVATKLVTLGNTTYTTIYHRNGNQVVVTTIRSTNVNGLNTILTLTHTYYGTTLYYDGVDVLNLFPYATVNYNVRVINGLILYTLYDVNNNTLTQMMLTVSKTYVAQATIIEEAIGNVTVATGTIAGWIN